MKPGPWKESMVLDVASSSYCKDIAVGRFKPYQYLHTVSIGASIGVTAVGSPGKHGLIMHLAATSGQLDNTTSRLLGTST